MSRALSSSTENASSDPAILLEQLNDLLGPYSSASSTSNPPTFERLTADLSGELARCERSLVEALHSAQDRAISSQDGGLLAAVNRALIEAERLHGSLEGQSESLKQVAVDLGQLESLQRAVRMRSVNMAKLSRLIEALSSLKEPLDRISEGLLKQLELEKDFEIAAERVLEACRDFWRRLEDFQQKEGTSGGGSSGGGSLAADLQAIKDLKIKAKQHEQRIASMAASKITSSFAKGILAELLQLQPLFSLVQRIDPPAHDRLLAVR